MRGSSPKLNSDEPVFAAIAGATLEGRETELFHGLKLRQTYVHVFAPTMAAFSRPPADKHHPGPWQIVHGAGEAATASVEIIIAPNAALIIEDRADLLRMISGTVRLLAGAPSYIAAVSNRTLSRDSAALADTRVDALEPAPAWPVRPIYINVAFSTMLCLLLKPTGSLFEDDTFYRAFVLADGIWWLPSRSAQMTALWTAAEILLRPEGAKGKGLASAIRRYIGRSKADGDRKYNEVIELYEARGGAVHAGRTMRDEDVYQSFCIVRDVFIRAIHEGQLPPPLASMQPVWTA